ncbi:MAG: precorrin-6Y C5,15-methyltransferase (decarboxylating) subunit CbiT [Methanomicrobiales archaeon]|nr:precorrin-6Y C5,15-methyltransferase (decarboxylating) subunit CbiT [Methanomicrobiales archaeon]MDI6876424.1 precorrin-6Y C5,15-methyltransferase (decarboxylating) subunit CbiT [Methanomicrobiales archaeon]
MGLPGGPTQDEIMAVALQKLGLRPTDRVADIGCGTGKVSMAIARQAERVYAIDRREEAIAEARGAAAGAGVSNIDFLPGEARQILGGLGELDAAFVGGSRDLPEVLGILARQVKGTIVVNAVLVNTLATAISTMRALGIFREAVLVQVARSREVGGEIMFRPIDPVYIVVGGAACS